MSRLFSALLPKRAGAAPAPVKAPESSPFDAMSPPQKLAQLERWGEEAYGRMYDARSPSGDYSEAKENFHRAIALAQELGLAEEAARLEQRLAHIKSVFRSQFS